MAVQDGLTGIWIWVFVGGVLLYVELQHRFGPALGEVAKLLLIAIPFLIDAVASAFLAYRYASDNPTSWGGMATVLVLGLLSPAAAYLIWRKSHDRKGLAIQRFRRAELWGLMAAVPLMFVLLTWVAGPTG